MTSQKTPTRPRPWINESDPHDEPEEVRAEDYRNSMGGLDDALDDFDTAVGELLDLGAEHAPDAAARARKLADAASAAIRALYQEIDGWAG